MPWGGVLICVGDPGTKGGVAVGGPGDRAVDTMASHVGSAVPRFDRGCGEQRRQLGELTLAGPNAALGLVVLDCFPALVDDPVRLVVLIDEYVGTEVGVECPGVVKRWAQDVARRGHRLGLVFEFKCRGDRHRRLLLWVVESPGVSAGSGRDRLHGSAKIGR